MVAVTVALALAAGLFVFIDLWFGRAQGQYATLTGGGLLAAAAVLGNVWGERLPLRILGRSLIVLALLALLAGSGFLALGWLGVWTSPSTRFSAEGQRALAFFVIWPVTGSFVWFLGTLALLIRRRFTPAAAYTICVFAVTAALRVIAVILPTWVPFLATVQFAKAPGWMGALCFLIADVAVVYVAWTRLFSTDFKAQVRS